MKQIFDSDLKYALDAVGAIEAIAEDMKNAVHSMSPSH